MDKHYKGPGLYIFYNRSTWRSWERTVANRAEFREAFAGLRVSQGKNLRVGCVGSEFIDG